MRAHQVETACGLCGKAPAAGLAFVDGIRYCHGDFDPDPTCYMRAQRLDSQASAIPRKGEPTTQCPNDCAGIIGGPGCDCAL